MVKQTRLYGLYSILVLALLCVFAVAAFAADGAFAGKWKGESKPAAPPPAPGAGGGAAASAAPASAPGGAAPAGGASTAGAPPAGGRPGGGGGGGGRGGFGGAGGFGGPQKVSLNLKQSKDNKLSGNITFGDNDAYDVKDGKVDGNTITFKAGRAPQPTYDYKGELKDDTLTLTRLAPEGGRGRAQDYILKKK